MQESLAEVETCIEHLEETSEWLHTDGDKRKNLMEIMWDRIQALENHSKRNNVRLIGLKETFGTNRTLLGCVHKMLTEGLGLRADAEFAAKEKRGFIWEGCRLSVFPDMTKSWRRRGEPSPLWSISCRSGRWSTRWPSRPHWGSSRGGRIWVSLWQRRRIHLLSTTTRVITEHPTREMSGYSCPGERATYML